MTRHRSPAREQVFQFIVNYKRVHDGLSPVVREIAVGCVLSESSVKYHLLRLENEGRIKLKGRRGIEVTGGAWDMPEEEAG